MQVLGVVVATNVLTVDEHARDGGAAGDLLQRGLNLAAIGDLVKLHGSEVDAEALE